MTHPDVVMAKTGQVWVNRGRQPHVTLDGRAVWLTVWRSQCTTCRGPIFTTLLENTDPIRSGALLVRNCKQHKRMHLRKLTRLTRKSLLPQMPQLAPSGPNGADGGCPKCPNLPHP